MRFPRRVEGHVERDIVVAWDDELELGGVGAEEVDGEAVL